MLLPSFPRIAVDPAVCGGRPTVAGTRMRVSDILDMLADGATPEAIAADFPYVRVKDVLACISSAAQPRSK